MGFQLQNASGADPGRTFSFDKKEARLGRTPENDIVVLDGAASRAHARVFEQNGRHFVEDLNSANGTLLNGERLTGIRGLTAGDRISIGETVFTFSAKDSPRGNQNTVIRAAPRALTGQARIAAEGDTASEETMRRPAPRPLKGASETGHPRKVHSPGAASNDEEDTSRRAADTLPGNQPEGPNPSSSADTQVGATAPLTRSGELERIEGQTQLNAAPVEDEPEEGTATDPLGRVSSSSRSNEKLEEEDELEDHLQEVPSTRPLALPPASKRGTRPLPPGASRLAQREPMSPLAVGGAAGEARLRRQAGRNFATRVAYRWSRLSTPEKTRAKAGLLVLALLGCAGAFAGWRDTPVDTRTEPTRLSRDLLPDSFGRGEGVEWERPDLKSFTFDLASASRSVVVLHYQAREIGLDEVAVFLNGTPLGTVPADTAEAETRGLEQVLPPGSLRKGSNTLLFDNTLNPPRAENWRVWSLWLEILPVPDLPPDELLRSAQIEVARARNFFNLREVGADNAFKAWKAYRDAWLILEALPEKPELYGVVREQLREIGPELDRKCGALMLEVHRALELHRYRKARQALEEIPRFFPTREHRCNSLAREQLERYGL